MSTPVHKPDDLLNRLWAAVRGHPALVGQIVAYGARPLASGALRIEVRGRVFRVQPLDLQRDFDGELARFRDWLDHLDR